MIETFSSPDETLNFARSFAQNLRGGEILALTGELGSGKTLFTQGLAEGLGIYDRIISPTYVLMRQYCGKKFNLYHIDLYRLQTQHEIEDLGLNEIWGKKDNIVVIEWAEKMKGLLPPETIWIKFKYTGEKTREINFRSARAA